MKFFANRPAEKMTAKHRAEIDRIAQTYDCTFVIANGQQWLEQDNGDDSTSDKKARRECMDACGL